MKIIDKLKNPYSITESIKDRLQKLICTIKYKAYFSYFGKDSILVKPDRIVGNKFISIGNNVIIMHHLRMEAIRGWKEKKYNAKIQIHDDVRIGQGCHITCAGEISIGKGSNILPYALITDIEHQYEIGKSISETPINVGRVFIGENVTIGAGTKILAGGKKIFIGNNAVIGANSIVKSNIEANTIVVGSPARKIRSLE